MFTERLNQIISEIGATSRQIAACSGLDESTLSRLRKGTRIPPDTSPTIEKMATGIYLYMDDKNTLETLCHLIGVNPEDSATQIKKGLIYWLYEGQDLSGISSKRGRPYSRKKPDCKTFGMRFDAVMKLAEFSNIRFSHLVSVDTSLVSRFRSGVRTPNANPIIARRITAVLWERIITMEKTGELAKLMRVPVKRLDENSFHHWLCYFDELYTMEASAAERISDSFDTFSTDSSITLPSPDEAAPPPHIKRCA